MNDAYLTELKSFLDRNIPQLASTDRLSVKGVLGAVGGYIDDTIFISCGNFGIALRLPPAAMQSVFEADDVLPLRYFPKGHIKREYAVIPNRIVEDRTLLAHLMGESVSYAQAI
ncbi:MAG: TfoX/Sxy family protein [SAR202 cluster bacterium]|nr:TfoX/Sxy family protein [SAR202 cluster bacterium]